MELVHQNPSRVSVPELLKELQVTKNELDNIRVSNYEPMKHKYSSHVLLAFAYSLLLQ